MQTGLLPLPTLVSAVAASLLLLPGFPQLPPAKEVSIVEILSQLQTTMAVMSHRKFSCGYLCVNWSGI